MIELQIATGLYVSQAGYLELVKLNASFMEKTVLRLAPLAFVYKTRQWTAEVKKIITDNRVSYVVRYHPSNDRSLSGLVTIVPGRPSSKSPIWKQYRRSISENVLQPEFINLLGREINNVEMRDSNQP